MNVEWRIPYVILKSNYIHMNLSLKHKDIYFVGIILLAIGLPLSMFIMSISQFILLGNWLIEGRLKEKLLIFRKNTLALSIASVFLLHLLGLLYTSNFNYALDDLRIKLPLFILPLVFSSSPQLKMKQFYIVLFFFIASVGIGTAMGMYRYMHMQAVDNSNIRDLITSISHIRFGLMLSLSIFMLWKFITDKKSELPFSNKQKFLFGLVLIWFICFMFILEAMTGIILSLIAIIVLLFIYIFQHKKIAYKLAGSLILIAIPFTIGTYLYYEYLAWFVPKPIDITKLETHTSHGNTYQHQITCEVENGNYVQTYVCMDELEQEWNKKSTIDFTKSDNKGQDIRQTLMRFLTSKGLRKDADGVDGLSENDIKAIENGIANEMYVHKSSFKARIHQTLWEVNVFLNNGDPNAHSLLQRVEYMKAALDIIKQHPLIGVGTGDIRDAFKIYYEETDSRLWPEWRNRTHNQYLSLGVAFGIVGMLWFILILLYPLSFSFVRKDFFYIVFFVIISLSMLSEDTIETQAGVTLFTFFQCLFLLVKASPIHKN